MCHFKNVHNKSRLYIKLLLPRFHHKLYYTVRNACTYWVYCGLFLARRSAIPAETFRSCPHDLGEAVGMSYCILLHPSQFTNSRSLTLLYVT
jgi:hypothetical protein